MVLAFILLNRRDGARTDVIELCLEDGEQSPTVEIQPVDTAYLRSPCSMKVDMFFMRQLGLRRGDLSLSKAFYHLSRLARLDVTYNLCGRNCDHVSTFLLTGKPMWTTYQWPSHLIKDIPLQNLYEGIVNNKMMEDIKTTMSD